MRLLIIALALIAATSAAAQTCTTTCRPSGLQGAIGSGQTCTTTCR